MICENGGCMSKIPGEKLFDLIRSAKDEAGLSDCSDLNLISVGTIEDCAVLHLETETILYSMDFGPLIGDDEYTAGVASVLNALSDIYATGGKPEYALVSIVINKELSNNYAKKILEGVYATCSQENVKVVGGHSIYGKENLVGLSVIGKAPYGRILHKQGGKIGDKIWITKPLGTGLVLRGYYHKIMNKVHYNEAMSVILKSNRISSNIVKSPEIHAMTDITGYGFIGHLSEMLERNQGAVIWLNSVPFLSAISQLSPVFMKNDYIMNNFHYASDRFRVRVPLCTIEEVALFDPQTNGGLIIIASPSKSLAEEGFYCIGEIIDDSSIQIK